MIENLSEAELHAYLDESLPAERMAVIEDALRATPELCNRVAVLLASRDAGLHSLGEIWRRGRLTCPSRAELRTFLLGLCEPELAGYFEFHLSTIGCRVCAANLADLQRLANADTDEPQRRRRKFFQSSAGLLRSQP